MVLRINAPDPTLPGIGRGHEAEVWRTASDAGIAPPLLHADPAGRFLVSAFIENELPEQPQDDPALAAMALELLQRTHHLDVKAPAIDYTAHIEAYWQQIEAGRLTVDPVLLEQREAMRELLLELSGGESWQVLCHHDPVIENFVGSPDRLYLIDWEYAARGLAMMDYAAFAVEWNIDDATIKESAGIDLQSLILAKTLYAYLCTLWEAIPATRS